MTVLLEAFIPMDQIACLIPDASPLQLPWKSNALHSDGLDTARGIAISIGDPPQLFSMIPMVAANNTVVLDVKQCGDPKNYSCAVINHGTYAPPSSVNVTSQIASWNGTNGWDVNNDYGYDSAYFNDDFVIGDRSIPGVPFFTYTPRTGFGKFKLFQNFEYC